MNTDILMRGATFLSRLISFYSFLIWIRILLSWVNPYTRPGSLTYYFSLLVDPYLNLFRSKHFRVGMIDFSPVIAIGVLSIVQSVVTVYASYGVFSLGLFLAIVINAIWEYALSFFFIFAIISLIFRTLTSFTGSTGVMYQIGNITTSLADKVRKLFFSKRLVHESTVNLITLIITLALYVGVRALVTYLIVAVQHLPW